LGGLLVAGSLAGGTLVQGAVMASASESGASVRQYSPGISDVVKMVDARVDAEVIKAYIQSSTIAYHPSAAEIIALKDHGVSADILTALLLRGSDLKAQERRASPAAQPASPVAPNPYATVPAYDYGAQPVYQDYPYYYPVYSYSYPSYGYNYGYDYGYSWPFFGSAFYLSFDPYCRFRHHDFRSFGHERRFAAHPYGYPGRFGGSRSYAGAGRMASFAGHNGGFSGFSSGGRTLSQGGGFHSGGGSHSGGSFHSGGGFRSGGGFHAGGGSAGRSMGHR